MVAITGMLEPRASTIVREIKNLIPYQSKEEIEDKESYLSFDPDLLNKYSKFANFLHWALEELLEDILKSGLSILEE